MHEYMHDSEYERYITILSPPLEGGEEEAMQIRNEIDKLYIHSES